MRLLTVAILASAFQVSALAFGAESSDFIYVNAKNVEVAPLLQTLKQLSREEILVNPALGLGSISISDQFPDALALLERLAETLHTVAGRGDGFLFLGQQAKRIQVKRSPDRENNCPHRYTDLRLTQERLQPTGLRKCEPLEFFPLARLRIAGIISQNDTTHALVVSPDGVTWSVRAGNYMGQDLGRVHSIDRTTVDLREIKQREDGEWVEAFNALEPR